MKWSRLGSNFLRKKTEETLKLYVKQRNKYVSFLKKAEKEYDQNLNEKNVTDNKKFWKTVKPLLSNKSVSREKINLTENEKMLTSESETAETLNNFFSNIVKKLIFQNLIQIIQLPKTLRIQFSKHFEI